MENTKAFTGIAQYYDVWVKYDGKNYNLKVIEKRDYLENWEINRIGRFFDTDHYPEDFMNEVIDYALENWNDLTEVKPLVD